MMKKDDNFAGAVRNYSEESREKVEDRFGGKTLKSLG